MPSNGIPDEKALKFVVNFLDDISRPNSGGKRKNGTKSKQPKNAKLRVGGGPPDETPALPSPLSTRTISLVEQIKSSSGKKTLSHSAGGASTGDVHSQLSEKLQSILTKLNNTGSSDIPLTQEETMIISLYSSVMELSQVKTAAQMVTENVQAQAQIEQAEQPAQMQEQEQQIQAQEQTLVENVMPAIEAITENTVAEVERLQALYAENAPPEQISSASTSAFINAFGRIKALFILLANYKTVLSEYDENLQNTNPKLYFMLSTIYSCISFLLFTIFKLFKLLMSFRLGQIYVIYVFYLLYSNGNPIVIFIANTLLYISRVTGVTATVKQLMDMCKRKLIEAIPAILSSAAINSLLTNTITRALMDPAVLRNFVQSLSPELAGQIVQNALPGLTQGLAQGLTPALTQGLIEGATPALIDGLTQGLAPALNQGLIQGAQPLMIEGVKQGVAQGAQLLVEQQAKSAVMSKIGGMAFKIGMGAVAGYLGADPGTVGLITNAAGGKLTKKLRKQKRKHVKTNKK